ncbi:MAG: division/cell wall cluster transcriptional repressor MraZ [Candidatus Rokubacteria bacterium]|nr:division/cell wall cluster transcriptional repressor MraZ [Candidatus Rokubacteria bacterium]
MFRGRFHHAIDPKGRVSIPSKFRDALERDYGEKRLVLVPNDHCLEVHPFREWERIEDKVKALPQMDRDVQKFNRLYISRAVDAAIDAQGRIQIPPEYRERAGLVKDVVLVGGVLKFEIWNKERWEEYDRTNQPELPSLFEKISSRGV